MLNSGKKNSKSLVRKTKKLNETKNHNPSPLHVTWSVPNNEFYIVGYTSLRMNGEIRQGTVLKGMHLGAITSLCEIYCSI